MTEVARSGQFNRVLSGSEVAVVRAARVVTCRRHKPVEARLLVETNGGTIPVAVKAEIPVRPFPDGVLAGARSPRQVAEKAKANPKEAALQFENGAVEMPDRPGLGADPEEDMIARFRI